MHSDQPKPNMRCTRKILNGLERLLEIVGLEAMAESVRPGWYTFEELKGESSRL